MEPVSTVCSGIITYNPDLPSLEALIKILAAEADNVILVDNHSDHPGEISNLLKRLFPTLNYIHNQKNHGLAAGINQVVQYALNHSYDFIWMFDQDSQPEIGLRNKLVSAYNQLKKSGHMIAAVGPCHVDKRTGDREPFVRFHLPKNEHILDNSKEDFIECDFLISSGCLMSAQAIQRIGMMEEFLFIDNVDLEWSFRAMSKGFKLYGVKNAIMLHSIGENLVRLPFWGLRMHIHSPIRTYYMTRNRFLLYKRDYIPFAWKVHDFKRFLVKLTASLLLTAKRKEHFLNFKKGICDGLKPVS